MVDKIDLKLPPTIALVYIPPSLGIAKKFARTEHRIPSAHKTLIDGIWCVIPDKLLSTY